MKPKILFITLLWLVNWEFASAQSSIGLQFNSTYIGRNAGINYQYKTDKKLKYGIGLNYHINTEIRRHDYLGLHKRGYPENIKDGFGLVLSTKYKLNTPKFKHINYLSLNIQYNRLASRTQAFIESDTPDVFVPTTILYKKMNVIASNACLNVEFPINPKWYLELQSGIGCAFFLNVDDALKVANKNHLFRFSYLLSIGLHRNLNVNSVLP